MGWTKKDVVGEPDQTLKVLGELQEVARPVGITFEEMVTLMGQCKELEDITYLSKHEEVAKNRTNRYSDGRGFLPITPFRS
ncbi:hypothetical protein NQ318_009676 [Aromia moschata]|uniref:Uncharacterized protein n=1 Tax=Aromia moschata TaxID=1265417 RepID=A0AAV8XC50_9CUCU|nr:hypothetical protein NQ318_009676 [Aromia moschata]